MFNRKHDFGPVRVQHLRSVDGVIHVYYDDESTTANRVARPTSDIGIAMNEGVTDIDRMVSVSAGSGEGLREITRVHVTNPYHLPEIRDRLARLLNPVFPLTGIITAQTVRLAGGEHVLSLVNLVCESGFTAADINRVKSVRDVAYVLPLQHKNPLRFMVDVADDAEQVATAAAARVGMYVIYPRHLVVRDT